MLSAVSWVCECGTHVKVMYDTNGVTIPICPAPPCQIRHPVRGKISHVWLAGADQRWQPVDTTRYIVPPEA